MNSREIPQWYNEYKDFIEESIARYLDRYLAIPLSSPLEDFKEVILYAFRWGKKLRSIMALEFYLSLSGKDFSDLKSDDDILKLCVAIEAVHAYSLVHDDLPCMDNDELRRWEATVWKKYGEYNAVLVWDLLNTLCFELISDIKDAHISRKISKSLSHAVWYYGMVWGQVEDLYFETHIEELDADALGNLHGRKTWALIEASIVSGVLLSGETSNMDVYKSFWRKLGLAFQIKDDLLDIEWTPEETWKSVWGEEKGFVHLLWADATRKILRDEIDDCKSIAAKLWSKKIDFIVDYVETRKK